MDPTIPTLFTHTTRPGGTEPRCGPDPTGAPIVAWEQVTDPQHPATFDCPACFTAVSHGREPMGGSQP